MGTNFLARIKFSARLQIIFWIAFTMFILYLSTEVIGWPGSLYRTLFLSGCHIFNFYIFYSWIIPKYYDGRKFVEMFLSITFVFVFLTTLRYYIETNLTASELIIRLKTPGRIVFIIFSEISMAGFAALIRFAVNHEENKTRILELEKIHLDAELRFLKAQMSPHFLFNTINNIYSLTLIKSDKAPEALMKMASLLRYLLYECHERVALRREIEAIESYVSLYQLKFEKKLAFELINHADYLDHSIEPMLLIPLLENAFKHSGIGSVKGSFVKVTMTTTPGRATMIFENSIAALTVNVDAGGIGLPNIQKRLSFVYPGQYGLNISKSDDLFRAELTIPFQ